MKMAKLMVGLVFILFFIPACKEPAPCVLTNRADSLLHEVISLNQKIISANLDSIQSVFSKISSEHALLSENMENFSNPDLSIERYLLLDSVTRIIGLCLNACNDFYSEISFSENQLEMILEEIAEGEIPDSTLSDKMDKESALLNDIKERVMLRMELLQNHLKIYEDIQPDIERYVEQINSKRPLE